MGKILLNYKLLNGIFFYIAWYACIYGASLDFELLGVATGAILIALHFFISKKRRSDLIFLGAFLAIGFLGDWLLISQHILAYPYVTFDITTLGVPLWILTIYASFSTTINHSAIFLHKHPVWCSIGGGIGGSVSYYLAAKIGAILLPLGWISLVAIAIYWFLILLFSKWLHDLLEKTIYEKSK